MSRLRIVALVIGCAVIGCRARSAEPLAIGRPAPAYSTRSIGGEPVSLSDLRGRVVLVNAWATWCRPCLEEVPEFTILHRKYEAKGLVVVGVSLDEDTATAPIRVFVQQHEMAYRIWHDPDQKLMTTFDLSGLPTSVLIDRAGVVRWMSTGQIAPGDTALDGAVRRALGP